MLAKTRLLQGNFVITMVTIFSIFVIALEQDIAQSATKNTHGIAHALETPKYRLFL